MFSAIHPPPKEDRGVLAHGVLKKSAGKNAIIKSYSITKMVNTVAFLLQQHNENYYTLISLLLVSFINIKSDTIEVKVKIVENTAALPKLLRITSA